MIAYETYMTASFNLGSGSAATNFIRSQFDYGARQRRGIRGYDTFSCKLVLDQSQMIDWVHFWELLNYGSDKFTTNEVINHDTSAGKICRFTSGYEVSQMGANKFMISVSLELIQKGSEAVTINDVGITSTFAVNAPIVTVV